MCEPMTIMAGATLAMGALSAVGQIQQGKAAQDMSNANAQAQNAAARDAVNVGNAQAAQQRQQIRQFQGMQTAAFGASGTDMTSGSALGIFGDTARGGALDTQSTLTQAMNQRNALNYQADISRTQGKLDRQSANLGAATTILNSALSAWGSYKSPGAKDMTPSENTMFKKLKNTPYGDGRFSF